MEAKNWTSLTVERFLMDPVNCLLIRWYFDRCYFKTSKIKGLKQWSRSEMFSIEKSMLLPAATRSLVSSQFLKLSISAYLQVCHLTHTVFQCVVNNCFVCCEKDSDWISA